MSDLSPQRRILVVDDEAAMSGLLRRILLQVGYEVETCDSGMEALAAVAAMPPDLILLDIDMPGMTGYETCERLKATEATADIPVLFVSGRSASQDTVLAFQVGAVDFISKPYQADEIRARIRTHLRLRELQQALAERNAELETAVASRTRELADANQRLHMLDQTKDDFLRIISHELRTPLNGVLGIGELIFDELDVSSDLAELRQAYTESRQRIESLLDEALTLVDINLGARTLPVRPVAVQEVLRRATGLVEDLSRSRHATVRVADTGLTVPGDDVWLTKAMHALLTAAVRLSAEGATIDVTGQETDQLHSIVIESAGTPIPEQVIGQLFDAFSVKEADTGGGSVGLGPPMAQRILGLFGAGVTAENCTPPGFRLAVSWPAGSKAIEEA
jgi:two-component system sensor histidine kinase/response regulator